MKRVPQDVLVQDVNGLNLAGPTLADQLTGPVNLLVFLRHFGCVFCREIVADLRDIAASTPDYPPVLFFFQGTVEQGKTFFAGHWPEARAVSDTPLVFYKAFGIERGGWRELFGPEVWSCGLRAARKGHGIGFPVGDPFVMPGAFLVSPSGAILWGHDFKHAGDHPDWTSLPVATTLSAQA
ncbi:MAG: SelL-related redox protein [Chloracidobacterium sp.]